MSLPPPAPFPPASIRLNLDLAEWEAALDAWLTLSECYLRLTSDNLALAFHDTLHARFLTSFYYEITHRQPEDGTFSIAKARVLQRKFFCLVDRLSEAENPPGFLLSWDFLSDFCRAHVRSAALARVVHALCKRPNTVVKTWRGHKDHLIGLLESKESETVEVKLRQLAPIMRASADIGSFLMAGSDFVDALTVAYNKTLQADARKPTVSIAYLGLISLTQTEPPTLSMLSDHLYSLKTHADEQPNVPSLLADLITNTPLSVRLGRSAGNHSADRLTRLLNDLETYRMPSLARPRNRFRHQESKAKGKAPTLNGELHVHRISLVTQIQDLFTDLGSGFVLRLLDEYGDDVEQVTAHLLDNSLPEHLQSLDRNEQAPIYDADEIEHVNHLAPRATPPPPDPFISDRRNIFDGDDLDSLEIDTSRLYIGKKEDRSNHGQPNKAAIISALAAFDSDDDERDDTYDVEDVGGTIDTAHPDGEPGPSAKVSQDENDIVLFKVYQASPELFARTFDVRKGEARQALKAETGMTDEAIEGWAIMLLRDTKRLKRLESELEASSFSGKQPELASTAYRESSIDTETEDSDTPAQRGGLTVQGRGRGRGSHGRGRGGNAAGQSSDPNTTAAQRRKEANKKSRANHNRRDQRARKLARAGFAG